MLLAVALAACTTTTRAGSNGRAPRDVSELVTLEGDAIVVRESISFAHGSAELEDRSLDLLDAVVAIMKRTEAITRLTIEGHTDTTGEPELNQPLSEARAETVRKYLEAHGVDAARLDAKGYGASRPIDSNDTEAGRARNRRVEFKVAR
ncbi:MAG: OmpA family protein [Myxococcota bacterium]